MVVHFRHIHFDSNGFFVRSIVPITRSRLFIHSHNLHFPFISVTHQHSEFNYLIKIMFSIAGSCSNWAQRNLFPSYKRDYSWILCAFLPTDVIYCWEYANNISADYGNFCNATKFISLILLYYFMTISWPWHSPSCILMPGFFLNTNFHFRHFQKMKVKCSLIMRKSS